MSELRDAVKDQGVAEPDWRRMAVPQPDGYDTDWTLRFAEAGGTPGRPLPYRRRPPGDDPTFCDGRVAVRQPQDRNPFSDRIVPANLCHPNLARSAAFLARWPAAYTQFVRLIDTVHPYTDASQARLGEMALGSCSHSYEEHFGSLHATVDDAFGLAQALLHEMAHQKLRALGLSVEHATRLIVNDPAQQFESPIRKDRTRPMTAVFHAQYAFIHVTALNLHMLSSSRDAKEHQRVLMLLARNVPRMRAGHEEVVRNVKVDQAGALFVDSFMAWSSDVVQQGSAILNENGYG